MNDPIEDFFKRDLTEAEKKQLAGKISASEESALRFADGARKAYQLTGLPEPVWEPRDWTQGGRGGWIKPFLLLALTAALLGFLYFKWRGRPTSPPAHPTAPAALAVKKSPPASRPSGTSLSTASGNPKVRESGPSVPAPGPIVLAKSQVFSSPPGQPPAEGSSASPRPAASVAAPVTVPARVPAPAPPASSPLAPLGSKYQELSVVVDRSSAGVTRVRVLDAQGSEIRAIYMGILPGGEKTFTWDGKTESGTLAPPGDYYLEVRSGENVLRHKVRINGRGNP